MKNKNKKYVNKFMEVIKLYNRMLQEAAEKYDYVEYCDITFLKDYLYSIMLEYMYRIFPLFLLFV